MTWQEEYRETFPPMDHYLDKNVAEGIEKYIEDLLEEQKKDFINQILSEAPEDIQKTGMIEDMRLRDGFNQANAQWREIINNISNNKLK